MAKNIFSKGIIGLTIQEFLQSFTETEDSPVQVIAQESRLIPIGKKDDEMAMASVFLSALKLVKEYRNLISDPIGLSKAGSIYCFTEVSFPVVFAEDDLKKKSRFDGLALIVSGGKIKDAAIFEMKQGKNEIEAEQIERYIEMAKTLGIPRLVSVSNQFVTKPSDYPIDINKPKKCPVALYHFSWMFVTYIAEILLKNNDTNIADEDQKLIMGEVVKYLYGTQSISTFDAMTVEKWKDVVLDLSSTSSLKAEYKKQREAIVKEWIQEEKSLALKLSSLLSGKEYTVVDCEKKKFGNVQERIKAETDTLNSNRTLNSIFKIKNAVAPLNVEVDFQFKIIKASMLISVPSDKKNSGKLAYVRKYIKKAQNNSLDFGTIERSINCILKSKSKRVDDLKYTLKEFMDPEFVVVPKDFDFLNVEILLEYDMGRDIQSPSKFVSILEKVTTDYYVNLMQYFEKWVSETPKAERSEQKITSQQTTSLVEDSVGERI